jgi:dihydroorotate dehydrogenase (NAD+) catalytic subunit
LLPSLNFPSSGERGCYCILWNAALLDLNGVRLRNRVVTSSSLLGYGAPRTRLLPFVPFGMSPIAPWVNLGRFGAVTARTLSLEPRAGHFTLQDEWRPHEFPQLLKLYDRALRRVDSGWLNAFGWANVGIEAYFKDYFPRTAYQNRIVSVGGFAAQEFCDLVDVVNAHAAPGEIAAVEFNISCHNVNFDFESIVEAVLAEAVPRSRHPVLLKLSADYDYLAHARLARHYGVAGLVAINTVKGLRLDPNTGEPWLKNGFGGLSGRAIKPIALRVVAELKAEGIDLPIIASGGIRTFDDCREFFWAGADAVSLGSEVWLAPYWRYFLAPVRGLLIQRLIGRVEGYEGAIRTRPGRRGGAAREFPPALGRDQQLLHR